MSERQLSFVATESSGEVSAVHVAPPDADCLLIFAHGAGAPMRHRFMQDMAARLAQRRIATFRFNFPYTEQRKRRPDYQPVLVKTIRSAVAEGASLAPGLPLFAGGKSMGGRMTSLAQSKEPLPGVRGLIFFGFPLHAAGKPSDERGEHLFDVDIPMLFLQGTRDSLASLDLVEPLCAKLNERDKDRATLHIIDDADHGFHVRKKSGRTDEESLDEIVDAVRAWCTRITDMIRA